MGATDVPSIISINISHEKGERKKPVDGAELQAGHGIAGDAHAGDWHRQVSLLALESIQSMKDKGLDVGPGDFAENITTEGIVLPSLVPGTRLRLGPALVEVTQIGKECHNRCEIFRQAGDCVMPREGIFARVLEGGAIGAGQQIAVLDEPAQPAEPAPAPDSPKNFTAAVVTVSDSCFRGEREDGSGELLAGLLAGAGAASVERILVPDDRQQITDALRKLCREDGVDLVITTGGTGVAPGDQTPEATREVIEREAPGFAEAIRAESLKITPRAMLSRAVSGICGATLVINFPGSPRACEESFAVIEPVLEHALELLSGRGGECAR